MFTGLIQHLATVAEIVSAETGARLVLDTTGWSHSPGRGDSIAVSGCCLTVADARDGNIQFDVIHQTLRMTKLGQLRAGNRVNIEHAATPTTLLGGHIVQGHVDGVGRVRSFATESGEHRMRIEPPGSLMEYIIERGSIAVDGVSLTIASRSDDAFEIALIPTTLALTTLGDLREDDTVNIEVDYLAKSVIEWAKRYAKSSTDQ